MVGPIISGSMSLHVGWRNFWWFNTALIGTSLLMVIFMFPETKWHRPQPNELDQGGKGAPMAEELTEQSATHTDEKATAPSAQASELLERAPTSTRDPWLGKGSPNKKQWGIYTPSARPFRSMLVHIWVPWKLFTFPIVELAAFIVSWSCSSFLTINLTQSQNFAAAPYHFNPQTIGFMNFAILIGAMIGLVTAGPMSDWISAHATKRNRGVREPEMRLPAMSKWLHRTTRCRDVDPCRI
jgi:MFS family permease